MFPPKKNFIEREQRETGQQTCQTKPLVCMQWIVFKEQKPTEREEETSRGVFALLPT